MKKILSTLALVPCLATTSCLIIDSGNGGGNGGGGNNSVVTAKDHYESESIEQDTIWDKEKIYVNGWLEVRKDLTIKCPANIYMGQGASITVKDTGNIHVDGEGANCKVVFTSQEGTPLPGDWQGIFIEDTAGNTSNLSNATLEYGGGDKEPMLFVGKKVKLNNVTLLDSKSFALSLGASAQLADLAVDSLEIGDMDTRDLISANVNSIGELKKFKKDVDDIGRIIANGNYITLSAGWVNLPAAIVLDNWTEIGGETTAIDVDWNNVEIRLQQDSTVKVSKASLDMDNVLVTTHTDRKRWGDIEYSDDSSKSVIKNSTFKDGGSRGYGYLIFGEDSLVTYDSSNNIENSSYDSTCYYTDYSGTSGIKEELGNARNCEGRQ